VVDDGSTVDLSAVLATYDGKFIYLRLPENRGLSAAVNAGLKIARGDFIDILNDDDGFMPDKIEKQIAVFDSRPDVDIVYTDFKWSNSD
jgi:glycosyltransferase involved in cell wall biosynthesis